MITTDTINPDPEAALEAERTDAYNNDSHQWQKPDGTSYDLQPFSDGRELLFWDLVENDGGVDWSRVSDQRDDAGVVLSAGNTMLFLPHAAKVIWLCSHVPADWRQWRRDRAAWLEEIDRWSALMIPRQRHGAAVDLAIEIINSATINKAVPRPADGSSKPGN